VPTNSAASGVARVALTLVFTAASTAAAQTDAPPPTWAGQVAAIVHRSCAGCHHPGGAAPMSLLTWDEARPWAKAMAREVAAGAMPPWHASPDHGRFANDRRLADEDRAVLIAWVAAGAPVGELGQAPTPPSFGEGWTIGEPDLVIELPADVTVPASGEVPYHDYVVDPGFAEDVWVRAAEARPGNRDVVHHIIVDYVIEDPLARRRLAQSGFDSRVQGSLGGYVPGDEPLVLGDGLARLIPAGAKIHFQMHYTPTGKVETDRSRLGIVLAPGPPLHEVRTGIASTPFISIPAGASDKTLQADFTFERESVLLSMRPHLHLRGKSFEYRALYPGGGEEILLWVPDYDFGWQTCYVLAEPKLMPAGTRLVVTGGWDNTSANPDNPDPSAVVSWGEQTSDEMMIGFFEYYETLPRD
jgi:mono/diheme cytochrome c family protein